MIFHRLGRTFQSACALRITTASPVNHTNITKATQTSRTTTLGKRQVCFCGLMSGLGEPCLAQQGRVLGKEDVLFEEAHEFRVISINGFLFAPTVPFTFVQGVEVRDIS